MSINSISFVVLAAPNYGFSWALVLLAVGLGLLVALKPSGRKVEFKRAGSVYDKD